VSIINLVKDKVGIFLLKKELDRIRRNRKPERFSKIKTIGILYLVPEEKEFPFISDFVKFLQDNCKVVKALGYTNSDYIPHYCFPKLTYDYFTKKNINWYGKPSHKFVDDFIKTDYDLMIDLNTRNIFTINYIGYLCQAKFKVGMMNDNNVKHYDLMMNVPENIALPDYIPQIKHYLTNLNITSNEQVV